MNSISKLPVENIFDEFVKEVGGELVRELMPRGVDIPKNADYLFCKEPLVAELKCLEKDIFKDKTYQRKLDRLYESWVNQGLIPPLRSSEDTVRLPPKCSEQYINLGRRPLEGRIRQADKQIKETKAYFGLKEAYGLLFIANDGNYSFENDAIRYLVGQILQMRGDSSSIDAFVYFTVNMKAKIAGDDTKWLVWLPSYRSKENDTISEFVNLLGNKWAHFYAHKIGEKIIDAQPEDESIVDKMRFIK